MWHGTFIWGSRLTPETIGDNKGPSLTYSSQRMGQMCLFITDLQRWSRCTQHTPRLATFTYSWVSSKLSNYLMCIHIQLSLGQA